MKNGETNLGKTLTKVVSLICSLSATWQIISNEILNLYSFKKEKNNFSISNYNTQYKINNSGKTDYKLNT